MYKWEEAIVDWVNKHIIIIAAVLVTILAFLVRKPMIETRSADYLANLIEIEGNHHTTFYMTCMNILAMYDAKPLLFLVKLLCILMDFLAAGSLAFLVFKKIKSNTNAKTSTKTSTTNPMFSGLVMFAAYLMLPSTLMNSSIWAHFDSGCIFLIVLSVLLWEKDKKYLSTVLLAVCGALLSQYLLFFAVAVVVILCMQKCSIRKMAQYVMIFAVTVIALSFTGLAFGYSPVACIARLNFISGVESFYLYPILILLLLCSFKERYVLLSFSFLELAVILDWGEFLYERPVLPSFVSSGFYAASLLTIVIIGVVKYRKKQLV